MRATLVYPLILFFVIHSAFAQTAQELSLETGSKPAQPPANLPKDNTPPPMKPAPKLSDAELELFLRAGKIVSQKKLDSGTTGSIKLSISDGKLTHDAQFQGIDVFKPLFRGAEGTVERNFRDSYKFNIAAYRLSKLLGMSNVPMSVERDVDGKLGSVTWWIDNIWMTEAERRDRGIKPPASQFWVDQLNVVRVFDQLIQNADRNQGNLLITPEWNLWLIDHTRAFRTAHILQKKNPLPGRVDHKLLIALRKLNTVQLKEQLGPYLRPEEISAILVRRDIIVRHFDSEIKQKGEDAVLTGIPRKTPEVTLP